MDEKPSTGLMLKALVSDEAMDRLYELRRETQRAEGVRTRDAVLVSLGLAVIASMLLIAAAWVPTDVRTYMASRPDIYSLSDDSMQWEAAGPLDADCFGSDHCIEFARMLPTRTQTLGEIDQFENASGKDRLVYLKLKVDTDRTQAIADEPAVVVSLPTFRFKRAEVYLDGRFLGAFHGGERLVASIEGSRLTQPLDYEILIQMPSSDRTLAGRRDMAGTIVATQAEWNRYRDFLGAQEVRAVGSMGHLAKIVLALFCLLLFLIVDSSSESYGLALFMGFEAAAMGIGEGWFPLGWFGIEGYQAVLSHFFYQMGDLLKLYFLLQIARVGRSSALAWLVVGALISIPYGFFMQWANQNGIAWVYKIARTRDTIVGLVGCFVCLRSLWFLSGKKLPWRKTALTVAAIAALFEVINTWIAHSELFRIYPAWKTAFTVFQANCGYLFALSTFLNISTLENRVRNLSRAKARAEEIERELEIGQIVQQALLKPPELPDCVSLTCHHEAALYVSGDTYFAHWDKERNVVTWLVNDVTGHGVQAALKASACNVLAKTIWEAQQDRLSYGDGSRLAEFDRVTQELLVEMNRTPDFNSMIGAEFEIDSGTVAIYRSNFTFPVLIEPVVELQDDMDPVLGEFWKPTILATHNQKVSIHKLKRGSFLLFMSDGFMESSREAKQFAHYLRTQLATRDESVTTGQISEMVLRYDRFRKIQDDRTLLVFQWTREGRAAGRHNDTRGILFGTR